MQTCRKGKLEASSRSVHTFLVPDEVDWATPARQEGLLADLKDQTHRALDTLGPDGWSVLACATPEPFCYLLREAAPAAGFFWLFGGALNLLPRHWNWFPEWMRTFAAAPRVAVAAENILISAQLLYLLGLQVLRLLYRTAQQHITKRHLHSSTGNIQIWTPRCDSTVGSSCCFGL